MRRNNQPEEGLDVVAESNTKNGTNPYQTFQVQVEVGLQNHV
jgi:hypothetical protein